MIYLKNKNDVILEIDFYHSDDGDTYIHCTYSLHYFVKINVINYSLKLISLFNNGLYTIETINFISDIDKLLNYSKNFYDSKDYKEMDLQIENFKIYIKDIANKYDLQIIEDKE